MEYIRLGKSGLNVSKICLGTMNMGSNKWKDWIYNEDESEPIVRHALDNGINFIDLADFYSSGMNEEVVCNIINRLGIRDEVILCTKVGYPIGKGQNNAGHSRVHILDAVHGSLSRMKTDYIDLYMIHYFDTNTPVEETWSTMNDLVREGKVRYLACSTMYSWQFAKILNTCEKYGWEKPINMQLQFSVAYREEEREMIPFCRDQDIGVSAFSPLARGLLTCEFSSIRNKTDFFTHEMFSDRVSQEIARSVARVAKKYDVPPAQVAQAYVIQKDGIDVMIAGADSPAQLDTAIKALNMDLLDDQIIYELERNYTPRDHINDHNVDSRIPREQRPIKAPFAEEQ
ncbi:MAG: aldo/keto reductase [Desulfocapsaceae bacterium]|nr:aldo/keto reductase [Desulfocapsaceae bacterium]